MRFEIKTELHTRNGLLADAPTFLVDVDENFNSKEYGGLSLGDLIIDEFCGDYGRPFAVGTKVIVERVA